VFLDALEWNGMQKWGKFEALRLEEEHMMPRNWRTSGNGELMKPLISPLLVVTWRLYIEDW
jgi:hypothetical protein